MKEKTKEILKNILLPIILGTVVGLLTKNHAPYIKSKLSPPDILFPIVWTILYGLMGLSYYWIKKYNDVKAKLYYIIQLTINLLWSFIFFKFQWFLLATIWIVILDIYVIFMITRFYKLNKKAALINIPYLMWIIFATVLCYNTYIIN